VSYQDEFDFDEQREHQERVSSRIARAILEFCRAHKRFHADELRKYVVSVTGIAAPASADRILRALRQEGRIDYIVENRRASLYLVTMVEGKAA
jgi:ribosomal protein S25